VARNPTTQHEYLRELRSHLSPLPESEQLDIIRDQEEYFRDAIQNGRSESDLIVSLGDPKQLAKTLIAESRILATENLLKPVGGSRIGIPAQLKSTLRAVLAIAALAPFNLIFVLGPFLALLGCLLAGWMVGAAFLIAGGAAIFFILTELMSITASSWAHVSSILFSLGVVAASLAFLGFMAWVSSLVAQLSVKYLRWNLQFVQAKT
jgi:uncharacterized membrane protein